MHETLEQGLAAVKARLPMLVLASLLAALAVWAAAERAAPAYTVHFSYLVSLSEAETGSDYQFDGYYALSATELFTETLAQWLTAPESVVAAYREAALPLPSADARRLTRAVTAQKKSSQLVAVTVRAPAEQEALMLAQGLQAVAARNVARYHEHGAPTLRFRTIATDQWVSRQELSAGVIAGAVFIFVLLALINGLLLWTSLRRE